MQRPSYLLSFLTIQSVRLGRKFVERYGGAFLVWEPGSWQPPKRDLVHTMGVTSDKAPPQPTATDALCFHLGRGAGPIRVGRAPENDCVVSDATVSRSHLVLEERDGAWVMTVAEGRQVMIDGAAIEGELTLASGAALKVGNVTLTLLDEAGLQRRMQ